MGLPRNTTDVNQAYSEFRNKWQDPTMRRYRLDAFVLITAALLGMIMILRALRYRAGWRSIKFLLTALYFISSHSLTYVLSKLDDYPSNDDFLWLMVVWAVFLIVLVGMNHNSNSESLEDNEANRKRFLLDNMLPSLWFFLLLIWDFPLNIYFLPVLIIWMLFILKLREKKQALIYACRSRVGLDRVAMVISEYMKHEHCVESSLYKTPNVTTMEGYRYLVGVKQALEQVTSVSPPCHEKLLDLEEIATVDKIWQCKEVLLGESGDPDGHLKDTCLSFALFCLILRRFADYELEELSSEEAREKTWRFVRHGLIKEQEDKKEFERAFRVVEVELQFLHDYFYNNYFAVYCKGTRFLVIRLLVVTSYLVVAFMTLNSIQAFVHNSKPWYDINNLQIHITQVIIGMLVVVELVHIINIVTSRWNKVKWICNYVQKRWWETRLGRFKQALLYVLCRAPSLMPFVKPWHRKLRQYSLLDSYGHNPLMLKFKFILEGYMDLPIRGQLEGAPIKLSSEVMKAVVFSLQTNGRRLSNGVASLQRHQVYDKLSWACKKDKRTTRVILVWHIATSMCEIALNQNLFTLKDFRVATSLSRYCAYLVAFSPKLLPDHIYITQWLFEEVVFEATKELKKCHSKEKKYQKLMSLSEESADASTLKEGALLGQNLIYGIEDAGLRWKVLADFWAEMILFLAPSTNTGAHAERLATGGEFITHLWALLTHAGIVDRDGSGD